MAPTKKPTPQSTTNPFLKGSLFSLFLLLGGVLVFIFVTWLSGKVIPNASGAASGVGSLGGVDDASSSVLSSPAGCGVSTGQTPTECESHPGGHYGFVCASPAAGGTNSCQQVTGATTCCTPDTGYECTDGKTCSYTGQGNTTYADCCSGGWEQPPLSDGSCKDGLSVSSSSGLCICEGSLVGVGDIGCSGTTTTHDGQCCVAGHSDTCSDDTWCGPGLTCSHSTGGTCYCSDGVDGHPTWLMGEKYCTGKPNSGNGCCSYCQVDLKNIEVSPLPGSPLSLCKTGAQNCCYVTGDSSKGGTDMCDAGSGTDINNYFTGNVDPEWGTKNFQCAPYDQKGFRTQKSAPSPSTSP